MDDATHLEQEEGVSFRREVRLGLGFVRPVNDQWTKATERGGNLIWGGQR